MSQKKVDSYKAGKNNRSRAARKEKLIDRLEILAWVAICVCYGCMDRIFRICKDNCQGSFRSEGNGCRYFSNR